MRDGFVVHGAEGALGGAIGTLLVKRRIPITSGPPDAPGSRAAPGERILAQIESIRGRPLPSRVRERIARAAPFAYSVAWGSLLGVAIAGLRVRTARRTLLAGAGMGALAWALGYARRLAGAGAGRPVHPGSVRSAAMSLASHVLYGVAVSAPIALLEHERRRRQPVWQRLAEEVGESRLACQIGARLRKVAR
jgi:hypothetical protein